jgi:hypothetical protein
MRKFLLILLLPAVLIGALLALLTPAASYLISLLISSLLTWASLVLLALGWRWCGGTKTLAWMVALAFLLRLGIGSGLYALLPVAGYESPAQQAGFLFADAYDRDQQAWELAHSNLPVYAGLSQQFISDQYGGQLMLCAAIYRYLSPDYHRPYLELILAAFAAAGGLLFLYQAVRLRWGQRMAVLAGWIYALYPESLLLGGSQLREPYLMALLAVCFWCVFEWKYHRLRAGLVLVISVAALFLFSSRVAAVSAGILLVLSWFEYRLDDRLGRRRWLGWVALALIAGLMLLLGWEWIRATAKWDAYLTERSSGWVQAIIDQLGERWRIPFVSLYGLAQPVLPAAIIYPGSALARVIVTFRSVGWYLLAPLLVYSLFALRRADKADRRVISWLIVAVLGWVLVSSMRAGGDQWDNPRYRTILIPLMALLAAWSWCTARDHRDPWLARLAVVELIFVLPFTGWYYLRYYTHASFIGFLPLAALVAGMCASVLIGSWLWDRRKPAVK